MRRLIRFNRGKTAVIAYYCTVKRVRALFIPRFNKNHRTIVIQKMVLSTLAKNKKWFYAFVPRHVDTGTYALRAALQRK